MVYRKTCGAGCRNKLISRLYNYFKMEAERDTLRVALSRPLERVTDCLGLTVETVRSVLRRGKRTCEASSPGTKSAGRPRTVDNFDQNAIRRFIHDKFQKKEFFTMQSLLDDAITAGKVPQSTSRASLGCWIRDMGFKHKTTKRKKYVAKKNMDLVSKRFRCLRALRDARAADRSLIYTDETWFTIRMTNGSEWIDTTKDEKDDAYSRQVPPGEGQRLITIAAGGKDGFLQESVVTFAARNAGGDYHGEVNLELYVKWLEKNLLPHLDAPSSIIIDNAP